MFKRLVAMGGGVGRHFGFGFSPVRRSAEVDLDRHVAPRQSECHPMRSRTAAVDHLLGPNAVERRVVMLAPAGSGLLHHAGWFDEATRGCMTFSHPAEARRALGLGGSSAATLVVDLAVFARLATALDWLIDLRNDVPGVVVVMASNRFSDHDMSCERFHAADASVRLPVSRSALGLAVSAAMTNHTFTKPLLRHSPIGGFALQA